MFGNLTRRLPLAALLVSATAAIVATWPVARHAGQRLPLGVERAPTVPLFNLWTMLWNVDRLRHGYAGYWDAPILHPEQGTFALSEPQPLTGLLFAPWYLLGRNPVLAYNLTVLLLLTANGVAAGRLLGGLHVARSAALCGAALAATLPFAINELGVLQDVVVFPVFLSLHHLRRFSDGGKRRDAHLLGVWAAATVLTCGHYGLFLSVLLLIAVPFLARRRLLTSAALRNLAEGVVAAALISSIFVLGQVTTLRQRGVVRPDEEIAAGSAAWTDFRGVCGTSWARQSTPWVAGPDHARFFLYPGTGLLALAAVGFIAGVARQRRRRWTLYCGVSVLAATLISMGLNVRLGDWVPYEALRSGYPGFAHVRTPARMAAMGQVFLVVLAGMGLHTVRRLASRALARRGLSGDTSRPHPRTFATSVPGMLLAVIAVLAIAETLTVPVRTTPYAVPDPDDDWVAWLRDQPRDEVVTLVPFAGGEDEAEYVRTVGWMLASLGHGLPITNGWSGYCPLSTYRLAEAMRDFPGRGALEALRAHGTTLLVAERSWIEERIDGISRRLLLERVGGAALTRAHESKSKLIYRLDE